jgi:hypothetical protein
VFARPRSMGAGHRPNPTFSHAGSVASPHVDAPTRDPATRAPERPNPRTPTAPAFARVIAGALRRGRAIACRAIFAQAEAGDPDKVSP